MAITDPLLEAEFIHELSFDHHTDRSMERAKQILAALNARPGFQIAADYPTDVVNGHVEIDFCDTRHRGEWIEFPDGHFEVISDESIERYFSDHGHRLVSVVGDKFFGNTLVRVYVYKYDDPPRLILFPKVEGGFHNLHESHWKRPIPFPTEEEIHSSLDSLDLMPSIEELDMRQLERNY